MVDLLRNALNLGEHLSLAKPRQAAAVSAQHQVTSWPQCFVFFGQTNEIASAISSI